MAVKAACPLLPQPRCPAMRPRRGQLSGGRPYFLPFRCSTGLSDLLLLLLVLEKIVARVCVASGTPLCMPQIMQH